MQIVHIPISPEQRKKIFALQKDLALSYDTLHEYMRDWSGATSLKSESCTAAQASKIIEALDAMQSQTTLKPRAHGEATAKQIHAIRQIARGKGWDTKRLNGFIKHTTGCSSLDSISSANASAVITGLKKMVVTKTT